MTKAELDAWEKDLQEREAELKKENKTQGERGDELDKWEAELKKSQDDLVKSKPAAGPATSMPCPTCNEPAELSDGKDKSTVSICANKHKHIHGAGLRKKLADLAQVVKREAVKSFPCPTCNQAATVENDRRSKDGTAISECAAGHKHVLSNSRRKALGIAVG